MARTPQIPKYRKHASGQARVTLNRKDYLLGAYGSAASHEAYQRIIAEWLSGTRRAPAPNKKEPTSVNAIILAYWQFAVGHYGSRPDERRGDYYCLRLYHRLADPVEAATCGCRFCKSWDASIEGKRRLRLPG